MPTVPANSGARVLVTGANGYIAMWVIRTLLEQGYRVRGAVRSEEKGKHLKEYFSKYGDKVEWTIVPDITKEGAFDEAVKGVEAIEHTASPLPSSAPDPDETIKPAVQGTLSVLQSALKYGSDVKRVVLTSSAGAIINPVTEPTAVFDESHWADAYLKDIKEKGKDNPAIVKYRASKVLAERAAWDFYKEHKGSIGWDLVALNPPLEPLQRVDTPENLNSSLEMWWKHIALEQPDDVLKGTYGYIDVRDVAAAHVVSLQKDAAGGERIIVANGKPAMLLSTTHRSH
ncbi:Putative uncharacterized oxidoreductase [Psilocybe cubensis]|uniref:Uncharacterized oxidoreductase n=1 Tax=Psilocybe cubensis TaxID=181762 RepID=A0ACB8HI67_PSICU|nr:Putative uncharacterized oxidoreductase [Psilocybe cubensis]KAH9487447.1 Putative uncharacterized oxidoreductase [Psilocybe cubensis]